MKIDLISLLIGFILGTVPFWLMASDISDGSELKSTATGAAIIAVIELIHKLAGKNPQE